MRKKISKILLILAILGLICISYNLHKISSEDQVFEEVHKLIVSVPGENHIDNLNKLNFEIDKNKRLQHLALLLDGVIIIMSIVMYLDFNKEEN